jgi:F-type H+-transporting ATPase subunit c
VHAPFSDLKGIGAGLVIVGAALGIGNLAKGAVDSMARQPEIAGNIQTAMIIAAALIEGVTFFALIIILLQVLFGG